MRHRKMAHGREPNPAGGVIDPMHDDPNRPSALAADIRKRIGSGFGPGCTRIVVREDIPARFKDLLARLRVEQSAERGDELPD